MDDRQLRRHGQRVMLRGLTEREAAELIRQFRKTIAAANELSRAIAGGGYGMMIWSKHDN
ncbi:hypothetical protein [Bradyrhizobium sp. WSM3983]|uniref:hypothetical protein n=1 Tax=Bradyrhizobium sp. WSM3983 TaxID=1038867 RepID=UPI000480ADFA|nr:hypothetical protein [Bradyrhizobium sp. WSM3983]